MAGEPTREYNYTSLQVGISVKVSTVRSISTQAMKLLFLAVFMLPSIVPTGFMAQRNVETGQFEIALCPSGFSQISIKILSGPKSSTQGHHGHHAHQPQSISDNPHLAHLGQLDQQSSATDHSSQHNGDSVELCPLAGPSAVIMDMATIDELPIVPVGILFTELPLVTRTVELLLPPARGPPAIS